MCRVGKGAQLKSGEGRRRAPLPTLRMRMRSYKSRALLDVGALGPFGGADLRAVGLHARDLEAAVGAHDRDAVGVDRDDLAELAGDALGVLCGERLRVE